MDKLIVYNQEDGIMAVCIPANNSGLSIEEIAEKDVPKGLKYKIVEDSVIPTDRAFRNAWEVDEKELTDGVGAWLQ